VDSGRIVAGLFVAAIAGVVVVVALQIGGGSGSPPSSPVPQSEPVSVPPEPVAPPLVDQAIDLCESIVTDHLKAPATAQFPGTEVFSDGGPEGPWSLKGAVDAENGFSALIRNYFTCNATYDSGSNTFHAELLHLDTYRQ
jgi:hypothetical protein